MHVKWRRLMIHSFVYPSGTYMAFKNKKREEERERIIKLQIKGGLEVKLGIPTQLTWPEPLVPISLLGFSLDQPLRSQLKIHY